MPHNGLRLPSENRFIAARTHWLHPSSSTMDSGGHFAAWEQPQLFSEEVRAGFRPHCKSI
jgi:pimeloyl-ACP methyl ester carboxylesterase